MTAPIAPRPADGRHRWWLAVAGSSALHGLLALLLLPPEARHRREDAVSIELHETAPAPAAAAPSEPPGEGSERPRRRHRALPAPPAPGPVPPAPGPPSPPASPTGAIALLPSADQLARAGVSVEAPPREAPGPAGPSRWQRGLADVQRRDAGRATVEAGKAPPETFDLLRDLQKIYAPSHELVLDLARKHAGRARNIDRWLGRYLGGFLARPEKTDQPFDPMAAFLRGLEKASVEQRARVCATFRPGADPDVQMDVSSGIRALDALAVQAVTRAAFRRVEQVPQTRACYLFSARLTRIPPIPVLACGIGVRGPECIYPLKEIATTRVTLDGVEPAQP